MRAFVALLAVAFPRRPPPSRASPCSPARTPSKSSSRRRCRRSSTTARRMSSSRGRSPIPPASSCPWPCSVRGITRRATDVCEFPPLRVQFTRRPPGQLAFRRAEQAQARHPLPQRRVVPAICAARIFRLQNVQCADPAQLPRAAGERRLPRRRRAADRLPRRLFHRGFGRRREAQRHAARPTRPTASR